LRYLPGECIGAKAPDFNDRLRGAYRDDAAYECWPDLDACQVGKGYFDIQRSRLGGSVEIVGVK
jgi:hypothetical protein